MSAQILIVEDDAYLLQAYEAGLAEAGMHIKIATDGDEALRILKTFTPDLIVLDIIMPRMDGFAVLEEMRNMEQMKRVPVIVATNLGQKDNEARAKELGAVDYITKSDFSISQVIDKIKTALKNAHA